MACQPRKVETILENIKTWYYINWNHPTYRGSNCETQKMKALKEIGRLRWVINQCHQKEKVALKPHLLRWKSKEWLTFIGIHRGV
jgi:hypothetical protein